MRSATKPRPSSSSAATSEPRGWSSGARALLAHPGLDARVLEQPQKFLDLRRRLDLRWRGRCLGGGAGRAQHEDERG